VLGDYRGIPREAMLLVYATLLPSLAFGMFYTDISYFLSSVQGIGDGYMSVLIMVMGLSSVAFSIPLGIAADRYGRKKMLIMGNIVESLIIAFFALTKDPALLMGIALLAGIGEAGFAASSSALLADTAGDMKRTASFSLFSFVSAVAAGIGGFAIPAVSIFERFGFSNQEAHVALYVLLAVLSLASTAFILMVKEVRPENKDGAGMKAYLPRKSIGVLKKYTLTGFMIAFGAGLFVPIMTRWFDAAYGVSDVVSGPIIGISNILIGVAALTAPFLARRLGIVKAIVTTQALSTAFMLATPLSLNFYMASTVYTARTFLMNMASPLENSLLMGIVAKEERGAASGISSALWRLPNAASTALGGWMIASGLLAMPFYIATVLYAISICLFWRFFGRTRLPEEAAYESG